MVKLLSIFVLAATSLTGAALADSSHRRVTSDPFGYSAIYEYRAPRVAPPAPHEDFGSFSAAGTARTLGY